MGTRHLIAVVKGGEYKVAQYGQWDGYPSGQGADVLQFLKDEVEIKSLEDNLAKVRWLDEEGRDKEMWDLYVEHAPEWSNEPDLRTEEEKYWWGTYMTRDLGAQILYHLASSKDEEIILRNHIKFAGDSLFCEWAYVVDLDNRVLEVYEGFVKKPHTGQRFSGFEIDKRKPDSALDQYYPIKFIKSYSFDELPEEKQFVMDLDPQEKEE